MTHMARSMVAAASAAFPPCSSIWAAGLTAWALPPATAPRFPLACQLAVLGGGSLAWRESPARIVAPAKMLALRKSRRGR